MPNEISAAEYPLAKIFSSDFEYSIPSYQRPYAWTVDEASKLFDDLYDFYDSEPDGNYFLGSVVLIKQGKSPKADVIDGQQRLTTLTILLATIADQMEGEDKDTLTQYIMESGNRFESREQKPRLTIRKRDQKFFKEYIQALNFDELLAIDQQIIGNESRQNIQKNSKHFKNNLEEKFEGDITLLDQFVTFLLKRCYLVVVSTSSEESAFRIFSVMNSRGLNLQPTDIIKAEIIGKIDGDDHQDVYNEHWEDMEVELGRSGFNDLFTYIRMIYAKSKPRRALLEEFRSYVLHSSPSPTEFIEDVLKPYAIALTIIKKSDYRATSNAQDVNSYLKCLNSIDNSDWLPPAILFLSKHKNEPEYVLWFFKKLERLAAYMHVCARNINARIERYAELLKGLERDHNINNPVLEIELNHSEKYAMAEALNGNIYELTPRRRNYIVLRLDSFMSDGAASYDPTFLTIEHVLPQTVSPESEWEEIWPDNDVRSAWVHRIANLVPLNKKRNSQAQNYDFDRKKSAYFGGERYISSYALTSQVLKSATWTPETLEDRQKKLLLVMEENWELQSDL